MPRPVFFTHKWKQSMQLLNWNTTKSYVCAKYWLKTILSEGETYFLAKSIRNESNCWSDQSKLRPKEIPRVCWRERIRNWNKKFRQTVNSTKLTKVNYAHLISFSSSCSLTKVKPIYYHFHESVLFFPVFMWDCAFHLCISNAHLCICERKFSTFFHHHTQKQSGCKDHFWYMMKVLKKLLGFMQLSPRLTLFWRMKKNCQMHR